MANKILVVLEQRDNQLKKISSETAKAGSELANKLGCDVEAVVVGADVENVSSIGGFGVNKVTVLKNQDLSNYSSSGYSKAIAELA